MIQKRWLEQYFIIFIIIALFCLVVFPLVTPAALGFLIAPTFYPLFRYFQKLLKGRSILAAGITSLLFTLCVVLPLGLIGIGVVKEAIKIFRIGSDWARDFNFSDSISLLSEQNRFSQFIPFSEQEIKEKLQEFLGIAGTKSATWLAGQASTLPLVALDIIIFIISFFYALVDGEKLGRFLESCLPFEKDEIADLFSTTQKICHGVVVGSLVAGLIQGIIIGCAYLIFGIPGALLFGATTALFSFVPIMGAGPTGVGGAIYLYVEGRPGAALGMLGVLLVASLSDNVVKPYVLKGSVELHPLLGLISVLGGLAIFGFVGLFLGPLFAAFMIVILEMIQRRNKSYVPTTIEG